MSLVNREKIMYGIQAFLLFLNIAEQSKSLKKEQVEAFREETILLLEKLTEECDEVAIQFNKIIATMNDSLSAPYPAFATDSLENMVKGEIVAFEHYLNQELKASHLTVEQEAPLFNDSLHLWEQVGLTLSPKEGIEEWAIIVEKLNGMLPENERYPSPDEEQYL